MSNKQTSLAAARAEVAKLDFSQNEVDYLKAKLLKLCDATMIVRSPERDEQGRIKYVEVPNVPVQLAATVKALEFSVGKPRQMIEVSDMSGGAKPSAGLRDLANLLHSNPEVAAKVLAALKDGVKVAEAIPVQAVTSVSPAQPSESESGASPSEARPSV